MEMDFTPLVELVKVGGVSFTVLVILLVMLYRTGKSITACISKKLDLWGQPVVDAHIGLVTELTVAVKEMREGINKIDTYIREQDHDCK
jgi:hypothetical protein